MAAPGQRPGGLHGAARAPGDGHRQPRRLAALLPRRRHRQAGGLRHRQRRGDGGRACRCTWRPASSSRRASRWPTCSASSSRWRRPREPPACRVVTGDTKVVERGKGDGVFITTTGVGVVPDGRRPRRDRARPGDAHPGQRHRRRPRRGHHVAARGPAASRPRSQATARPCTAWSRRCCRPRRTCTACATRRAAGWRRRSTSWPRSPGAASARSARPRSRCGQPVEAACEIPGPGPAVRGQRGQARRDLCRRPTRRGCWRPCARIRWARRRRSSARCIADAHHFVQMDTRFGGRRNVDWLTGEQLPRIC